MTVLFFEQLFGGGTVLRSSVDMGFDPADLGFQSFDAGVQLLDRHGVEILFRKLHKWVARLAREEILEVHGQIVDLSGPGVNKPAP